MLAQNSRVFFRDTRLFSEYAAFLRRLRRKEFVQNLPWNAVLVLADFDGTGEQNALFWTTELERRKETKCSAVASKLGKQFGMYLAGVEMA